MFWILFEKYKLRWCDYFNKVVYVYNCIKNDVMGYVLFFLLFGRVFCFFIDLMFNFKFFSGFSFYLEYVKKWRNVMLEVYKIVLEIVQWNVQYGKKQYDKKVCRIVLELGDRVFV